MALEHRQEEPGDTTIYLVVIHPRSRLELYTYDYQEKFAPKMVFSYDLQDAPLMGWSPLGSYVAGFGGMQVTVMAAEHGGNTIFNAELEGTFVQFSPRETFLSLTTHTKKREVKIVRIDGFHTVKCFKMSQSIRCANNDAYFATVAGKEKKLHIYETSTFSCLDHGQSGHVNVRNCFWSLRGTGLVLFGFPVSDSDDRGWLKIINVPSREELCSSFVEKADGSSFIGETSGDWLTVMCGEAKEHVCHERRWEEGGQSFALIQGKDGSLQNSLEVFKRDGCGKYSLWSKFSGLERDMVVRMLDCMPNSVAWDPAGRFIAASINDTHKEAHMLKLWSFSTGEVLYECHGYARIEIRLCFASGSEGEQTTKGTQPKRTSVDLHGSTDCPGLEAKRICTDNNNEV